MLLLHLTTTLSASFMLLPSLSAASSASVSVPSTFQHVSVVSSELLQELKESPNISVVYFFVKDSQDIGKFLQEYEESAKYLKGYNITLALYNCSTDVSDHEMCKKEKVELDVYTYQNGTALLTLTLDTMFDVDSIMANTLQLALLHQVPIIQTRQELHDLQRTSMGKQDILLFTILICGTEEHRISLEVAYAFQDRFKFALIVDSKIKRDLQNNELPITKASFALYVMFCAESTDARDGTVNELCHQVQYKGEITFAAVAHYVKGLAEKTLYQAPADGLREVFDMPGHLPIFFVYFNEEVQYQVITVAKLAKYELRGVAKVVFVNMDDKACRALAEEQGVSGSLPVLGVKKDGVMMFMEHDKMWTDYNVQKFISKVFPTEELASGSDEADVETSSFVDQVQIQDDQIAGAVFELRNEKMELDHVPALLKPNFNKTIMNADLKMVLFYLPFDHIGMAFLREFGHTGHILANNFSEPDVLARVNCYDGTDVCTAENITTYPLLRIYQRGQGSQDYMETLESNSVIKAVKLLRLNSPVLLTSKQEVEQFFKGEHPQSFQNFTHSSVLLLTSKKDTDEEKIFNNVAQSLSTITAFGVVHGDLSASIAQIYSLPVPSVMSVHRKDADKPIRDLNSPLSELSLTDFVKNSIIASVPELTIMNMPTLFARKQPFAILFLNKSDLKSKLVMKIFTQVAMAGQMKNIVFCWMNVQANTIGQRIMSEYTWRDTLPMITVLDHAKERLFNFQPEEHNQEDTSEWLHTAEWLDRVLANKVRPSKMLENAKWLPPGPHYDFLAIIDELENRDKQDNYAKSDDDSLREEQLNKDQVSQEIPMPDHDDKEALRIYIEAREEMMELRKSRIYHQNQEQHDGNRNHHLGDQESSSGHTQAHVEL